MSDNTVWLVFALPLGLVAWLEYTARRDHRRAQQRDHAYLEHLERLLREFGACQHEPTAAALLASAYIRAIQRGKGRTL